MRYQLNATPQLTSLASSSDTKFKIRVRKSTGVINIQVTQTLFSHVRRKRELRPEIQKVVVAGVIQTQTVKR